MKRIKTHKIILLVIGAQCLAYVILVLRRSKVSDDEEKNRDDSPRNVIYGARVLNTADGKGDSQMSDDGGSTLDDEYGGKYPGEGYKNLGEEGGEGPGAGDQKERDQEATSGHPRALTNQEKTALEESMSWDDVQATRKKILRGVCKNQPELNVNMTWIIHEHRRWLWPLIYNDEHRLIYCFVSKIASTNWKSAFLVLMGKYKRVEDVKGSWAHDPSIPKLSGLKPEEIEFRLENYTKFLFVRDPLSRALSGYRSKFLKPNRAFQKGLGRRLIKMYRPNPDPKAMETGQGVTFAEFVKYLSNAEPAGMDGHWRPIHDMVLPCGVEFDYIAKLETGQRDSRNILERAGVDHLIYFKESKRNVSHGEDVFNSFFDQIRPEYIKGLYKQYELDFELFDYTLPLHMRPWVFGTP